MIKVHAVQTGKAKTKKAQMFESGGSLVRLIKILLTKNWTDWLPIYCWAIEHPEGIFLVDVGESAKVNEPGYLPSSMAFRRTACFSVEPEDEIDVQLECLGIDPGQVKAVILTHLHTDHVGGLHHFPGSKVLVGDTEYQAATGPKAESIGYLPYNWPEWFKPDLIAFADGPIGPFDRSTRITQDGAIVAVPTPGHSPGHLAVIVKADGINYFLGGDTSYNCVTVADCIPSLVMGNPKAVDSVKRIRQFAEQNPTVFLGSHDPEARTMLEQKQTVFA